MQSITFRTLTDIADFNTMEEIQLSVWGPHMPTPSHQSYTSTHVGGVSIGAFDADRMVGFCYGFPAWDGRAAWLHSHMLAVLPAYRKSGLGEELKWLQRAAALARGYRLMTWTFSPMEAANAYLNLAKLGAVVRRYMPNYYGEMNDALNRGLPSDRMWVEWELTSPRVEALATARPDPAAPGAAGGTGAGRLRSGVNPALPILLPVAPGSPWPRPGEPDLAPDGRPGAGLPVPWSFQHLKQHDGPLAAAWCQRVAAVLQHWFAAGYAATGFAAPPPPDRRPGGLGHYILVKER